jgi:hypothetical protein
LSVSNVIFILIYNVEKATNFNNENNANNTTTNTTMNTPTTNTTTSTNNTTNTAKINNNNNSNSNNNNNNLNDSSKLEEGITAPDSVPLRDIFHSLELDRAAMIEQRKLEVKSSKNFQYIQSFILPI